jgi:16S rRNA U1498 N3-methylase RsmE
MRRRFIADAWTETTATLKGDQAVHLARVLRAQPGQVFDVVAGGFLHRAEITSSRRRHEVVFTLHEELEAECRVAGASADGGVQVRSHGVGDREGDGVGSANGLRR